MNLKECNLFWCGTATIALLLVSVRVAVSSCTTKDLSVASLGIQNEIVFIDNEVSEIKSFCFELGPKVESGDCVKIRGQGSSFYYNDKLVFESKSRVSDYVLNFFTPSFYKNENGEQAFHIAKSRDFSDATNHATPTAGLVMKNIEALIFSCTNFDNVTVYNVGDLSGSAKSLEFSSKKYNSNPKYSFLLKKSSGYKLIVDRKNKAVVAYCNPAGVAFPIVKDCFLLEGVIKGVRATVSVTTAAFKVVHPDEVSHVDFHMDSYYIKIYPGSCVMSLIESRKESFFTDLWMGKYLNDQDENFRRIQYKSYILADAGYLRRPYGICDTNGFFAMTLYDATGESNSKSLRGKSIDQEENFEWVFKSAKDIEMNSILRAMKILNQDANNIKHEQDISHSQNALLIGTGNSDRVNYCKFEINLESQTYDELKNTINNAGIKVEHKKI